MDRNEEVKLKGLVAGFIRYMMNVYQVPEDLAVLQGTNVFVFLNEYLPKMGHVVLKVEAENEYANPRVLAGELEPHLKAGRDPGKPVHGSPGTPGSPRSKRRNSPGRKRKSS
jgi:hypothetical protein